MLRRGLSCSNLSFPRSEICSIVYTDGIALVYNPAETETSFRPSNQEIRPNKAVPVRLSLSAIEVEIYSDTQGPLAYGWIVRTRIRGT